MELVGRILLKWKIYIIGNQQYKEFIVFYDIHYYPIIYLCETSVILNPKGFKNLWGLVKNQQKKPAQFVNGF